MSDANRTRPGVCEVWSVRMLLVHLDTWHEMFVGWEAAGSRGETAADAGPGVLVVARFQRSTRHILPAATKADDWDDVEQRLRDSYARVLERVDAYDEADLFTKMLFFVDGIDVGGQLHDLGHLEPLPSGQRN